jgi:hypothetical protein
MHVKVTTKCGRCGRPEEMEMSLEEAQELQEKNGGDSQFLIELQSMLENNTEEGPEALFLLRDPEDRSKYTIRTLDNLCHRPDAAKMQGCKVRVKNLLDQIFMEGEAAKVVPEEKKTRKPRAKKNKEEALEQPEVTA